MNRARDVAVAPGARGRSAGDRLWPELRQSFRNPDFWALSSWLDIIVRARKSRFGVLWLLAPSAVYVFGLGAFMAGMQGRTVAEFAVFVALGAMVFRTVMSAIIASANAFSSNHAFIMDGHTRLTDFLLQSLARAFFDLCMYLPVTVIALLIAPDLNLQGLLWAPLSLALIYLNALWICVVFGLAGARFPDVGQFISQVSIFLFLLTPIIWYPALMPPESLRGQLMRANPFYHFVEIFRAPILGESVATMSYYYIGIMTVVGLLLATFLYRRYARYVPLWI